ncbi:hypothetical protein K504DRAFT_277387 [Pleomassaria siparia CBS 279.74]|uniref:Methyltransferase type 11 domain-containing protein n=1 Tax=Pleomassaria siparia CBS 279.74 TaxID=1314801 RepID=A0A6G1K9J7_9PLEO|nr:hypothetical protein K504DRAFT_277387 [Pleomassaria siparia CBS 279.74]
MASYKSQLNPPRRVEEQTPYAQRAPTTRLPQRSVTPVAAITSQISHSKLQKKRPARDEPKSSSRGTIGQRVPVPTSRTLQGRQGSTTPSVPTAHFDPSFSVSKTVRQASSSRLPKLEVIGNAHTPELVSGSSTSTVDSPRSNVPRRKPSSIGAPTERQGSQQREGSMSSQDEQQPMKAIPGGYKDPFSETVMGISMPSSSSILAHSDFELEVPDSRFYEYDLGPTDILPLPTPQYALSSTPSTRYSESPGPFSLSSTPTSMSSYSPGVALSIKSTTRARQASPLQSRPPPVTRHRTPDEPSIRQQHALSSVRESSTSSSSASTIMAEGARRQEKQSSARLPAPPSSPPAHMSFAQHTATRSKTEPARNGYQSPPVTDQKPRIQAPPELAHLADQPPTSLPESRRPSLPESRRPTRPSRDGASAIYGLRGPSPIIQSNMTVFPSSHRRTTSSESKTGIIPNGKSRFGIPSKPSSRNPSPNPSLASDLPPSTSSRGPTRGPTPELQVSTDKQRSKTYPNPVTSPTSGPTPSPSKTSRFGFFSRRTKTDPVVSAAKSDKKLNRRGPVAGTGHEGYGRYALRGRSGSSVSGTSIGRSASAGTTSESLDRTPTSRKSSMTSTTSTEMDDFFLERLAPVVIRGIGSNTELSRSPEPMHSSSSVDLISPRRQAPQKSTSNTPRPNLGNQRPTLLPSAMSGPVRRESPTKKMVLGSRPPSESDDDATKKSFVPVLAARRTSRASKLMDGAPLSKVPSSGSTMERQRKGSLVDYASDGKDGKKMKPRKVKTEKAQPKPTRKWNFFQRAQAVPKKEVAVAETPVVDNRVTTSRSVAHYAPTNSQSGIAFEDIEQLMQEADSASEDTSPPQEINHVALPDNEPEKQERMLSMLLPPMPVLPANFALPRPASPKVFIRHKLQPAQPTQQKLTIDTDFKPVSYTHAPAPPSQGDLTPVTDLSPCSTPSQSFSPVEFEPLPEPTPVATFVAPPKDLAPPDPPPTNPPPRPSRLMQVGRIPQVVSRRNQERQRTPQSFSRPFVADQPRPYAAPQTSFDPVSPFTATAGPIEPYPVLRGITSLSHESAIATMSPSAEESNRQSEFFKFPARKNSEVSYSSSSGAWSFAPASGTAVVPNSAAPQSEDEVWNEYDDLIDEVLSPIDSSTSESKGWAMGQHPSLEPMPLKTKHACTKSASSITGPSVPSLHLRRSRLLAVLHSAQSPTSPLSLSEYIQDYGEKSLSVVDPVTGRLSFSASARMSTGSASRNRPSSIRSSLPASLTLSARQSKATLNSSSDRDRDSATANRYRDTRLMEIAEAQTDGLVSMANLRFGALMTSKWLSFGRVLFSPVHFELKDPSEDRVLVIDGLGKDWSYYCALTYPEATVYNLGPGDASSAAPPDNTPEPWSTLRNHRHISHQSLADAFPFPKGFFAAVVLRFPSALSSQVHRTVVSECKRVLQPGGHLEITVLDLDLVNMGNRARRAVRGLKVKMQVADEQVSLRNVSDEIMAGLGRKGFIECNRCFVGVPVAGKLPGSDEIDASEGRKRKGSAASSISKVVGSTAPVPKKPKPEVSFSDLLNAQPSTESTNDDIAEMVARVGRWWYSRCYESLVLPEAGEPGVNPGHLLESSIWRDENLIKECEKRGTSFRLLIGYAQKPEVGFRRTVSV